VSMSECTGDRAIRPERRCGIDRRARQRRRESAASIGSAGGVQTMDRRRGERRHLVRRADDEPSLHCPDCGGLLRYEAELSWALASSYTVDAGYCPSCARAYLRNRETGDYDALSW
jgi:hypothetical protein